MALGIKYVREISEVKYELNTSIMTRLKKKTKPKPKARQK